MKRGYVRCKKCDDMFDREKTSPYCKKCRPKQTKVYTHCGRCGNPKDIPNTFYYCKKCISGISNDFKKRKRQITAIKKGSLITQQINEFVEKVKSNKYNVDLWDINNIIEYYMAITTNMNEYDAYRSGTQVVKMFNKLCHFVEKHYKVTT